MLVIPGAVGKDTCDGVTRRDLMRIGGSALIGFGLADLFLDTRPYNAHSSASDALWAGVPVLTQPGDTFAGRVGAFLLGGTAGSAVYEAVRKMASLRTTETKEASTPAP